MNFLKKLFKRNEIKKQKTIKQDMFNQLGAEIINDNPLPKLSDKNGFDRDGYDCNGYNQAGYDRNGFDVEGYDINGYNSLGFDQDGYNKQGYNVQGFNKNGFDRDGYDCKGYNQAGYDRDGFNVEGYNNKGYDRDGFNKRGFNRQGFDREGYDQKGYNNLGLNREGYDLLGFDIERYNADGFNIIGYNRKGFDSSLFNVQGYNLAGFDRNGFDKEGFDKKQINIYKHHKSEYDEHGFLIASGFNDQGFNAAGYDYDGFDREGYNKQGYNRQGFDKNGYDCNGYDIDGYDQSGHDSLGFNHDGYNIYGFNHYGYNKEGFDENGFDLCGYDLEGYDINGYDKNGLDRKGHTEEYNRLKKNDEVMIEKLPIDSTVYSLIYGPMQLLHKDKNILYFISDKLNAKPSLSMESINIHFSKNPPKEISTTKYGKLKVLLNNHHDFLVGNNFLREYKRYSKDAFRKYIFVEMPDEWHMAESNFDINIFNEEAYHLKNVLQYVNSVYFNSLEERLKNKYLRQYDEIKKVDFNISKESYLNTAQNEFRNIKGSIQSEPYFGSIILNGEKIYFGRKEIKSNNEYKVLDWGDKRYQYYVNFRDYLSNKNINLSLVRRYNICYDTLYMYFDTYDSKISSEFNSMNDEMLTKLLMAHRNDKRVTDIVKSISNLQYEITSQDLNNEMVIQGCAGSGKTMIMYHRLHYLLFNYNINIKDVIFLSPSSLLELQTEYLIESLNIQQVRRSVISEYICSIYKAYHSQKQLYNPIKKYNLNLENINYDLFNYDYLNHLVFTLKSGLKDKSIIKKENSRLQYYYNRIKNLISKEMNISIEDLINLYHDVSRICRRYSFQNYEKIISNLELYVEELSNFDNYITLIELFRKNGLMNGICTEMEKDRIDKVKHAKESLEEEIYLILNPLFQLTNGYDIQKLYSIDFACPKDFIDYLVQHSDVCMKLDLKFIQEMLNSIMIISNKLANTIIDSCLAKKQELFEVSHMLKIMKFLYNSSYIGNQEVIENGEIFGDSLDGYKRFKNVYRFFNLFKWNDVIDKKFQLTNEIKDPFQFVEVIQYLEDKINRFHQLKEGNNHQYIWDLIFDILNPKWKIYKKVEVLNYDMLFSMTYILSYLMGALDQNQKIIFIDEFQDLSISEIVLLKNAFPHAVLNYYGDVNQCMSPKGINSLDDFINVFSNTKKYEMNVNYRNAADITEYVNQVIQLPKKMEVTGIRGSVMNVHYDKKEILNSFQYTKDDRVAYIIKNKQCADLEFIKSLGVIDIAKKDFEIVPRGKLLLYEVQETKGLEFDIVYVDNTDMTNNEKYVAYTRALDSLVVIE